MSNYELWQIDKYGDILPPVEVTPKGECENREEELQRFQEWMELQNDLQMEMSEHYSYTL